MLIKQSSSGNIPRLVEEDQLLWSILALLACRETSAYGEEGPLKKCDISELVINVATTSCSGFSAAVFWHESISKAFLRHISYLHSRYRSSNEGNCSVAVVFSRV